MTAAPAPAPAPEAPEEKAPPAAAPPAPPDPTLDIESSEEPVEEGAPAWMMTFGDMMSLLLTFFILLFSMSEIEVEKFRLAAQSVREAFGESTGQLLLNDAPPLSESTENAPVMELTVDGAVDMVLDDIAERLREFVEENALEQNVMVAREDHGVFLRIQDVTLFPPGAANIEEASVWIVERLADVTNLINVAVVVSGHTDNIPIRSAAYRSNWELSAARAAGVARTMVTWGQDPTLVTVEAFGEYQPVDTNDTPEGRARNRRVELYYSRQNVGVALKDLGIDSGEETGGR